jgi:MFS family permease
VTTEPDDELVPVSVRLGEVVPPEDPEDWTRPLTWVAAFGMLAGPFTALAWFVIAPPGESHPALPATYVVAALVTGGAATTGATQLGRARAGTATIGAGLFAALVVIILGAITADERQVRVASPTLTHAFAAAAAGVAGAGIAALMAAVVAHLRSRLVRLLPALIVGVVVSTVAVAALLGTAQLELGGRARLDEQARRLVVGADVEERRVDDRAPIEGYRTAGVESAA